MTFPLQLPLALKVTSAYNQADFYPSSCNQEAFLWVQRWPQWPTSGLLLHGPSGCGKTHLAYLWQEKSQAHFLTLKELKNNNINDLFLAHSTFILDDGEEIADEELLLHFYNIVHEHRGSFLLLAQTPPNQWRLTLPDLKSRLNAMHAIEIKAPDDALLATLICKLFSDKQLSIDNSVVRYLMRHSDRSFKGIQEVIERINRQALAQRRNITLPLVREVVKQFSVQE